MFLREAEGAVPLVLCSTPCGCKADLRVRSVSDLATTPRAIVHGHTQQVGIPLGTDDHGEFAGRPS
jgi:hypothetical protein